MANSVEKVAKQPRKMAKRIKKVANPPRKMAKTKIPCTKCAGD
jgi:hypothetical protein